MLTVQVLLLGPHHFVRGGFADGSGYGRSRNAVLSSCDAICQRLTRHLRLPFVPLPALQRQKTREGKGLAGCGPWGGGGRRTELLRPPRPAARTFASPDNSSAAAWGKKKGDFRHCGDRKKKIRRIEGDGTNRERREERRGGKLTPTSPARVLPPAASPACPPPPAPRKGRHQRPGGVRQRRHRPVRASFPPSSGRRRRRPDPPPGPDSPRCGAGCPLLPPPPPGCAGRARPGSRRCYFQPNPPAA